MMGAIEVRIPDHDSMLNSRVKMSLALNYVITVACALTNFVQLVDPPDNGGDEVRRGPDTRS